jgi:hypothetical protein
VKLLPRFVGRVNELAPRLYYKESNLCDSRITAMQKLQLTGKLGTRARQCESPENRRTPPKYFRALGLSFALTRSLSIDATFVPLPKLSSDCAILGESIERLPIVSKDSTFEGLAYLSCVCRID